MSKPPDSLRILVADDHYIVRAGLVASLEREDDFAVVAEAEFRDEAIARAAETRPDIAILDMQLGDGDGIEVLEALADLSPDTRAMILSVSTSENHVVRAARAGAAGYLSKSADREELIDAIRSIAAGETYFPSAIYSILQSGKARIALSARETDVLQLLAKGLRNREIADQLGLSEMTVKQHVSSVLHKLDVQDRTQAAIAAVERGLVSLD